MEALAVHSTIMAEIGRRQTAADLDARQRAELRAECAATIGVLDAWLASSTRRVEHRAPMRCGMCGADPHYPGCCVWSAGFEVRATQPQQFVMVDGELVEIEYRTGQIIDIR